MIILMDINLGKMVVTVILLWSPADITISSQEDNETDVKIQETRTEASVLL